MTRSPLDPPVFRTIEVCAKGETSSHLATWCPWCEQVHRHGAGGGDGHRTAHCIGKVPSPLSSVGYELDIVGSAVTEAAIIPDGLLVGERRLHIGMARVGLELSRLAIGAVLNLVSIARDTVRAEVPGGSLWIFGRSTRWLLDANGETIEGTGMMHLMAKLCGVPAGVVAVRLLEATTRETLDAEAALAVQQAIDDWIDRGSPKRGDIA